MAKRKTHAEFVEQAHNKHNKKYNYISPYINDSTKIIIECPIHGIFKQSPGSHLSGCGCPKCAIAYTSEILKKTNESFLIKANAIHKNLYLYLEEYSGAKKKIKIKCEKHGIFMQTPDKHLQGNGCPKCAGRIRKTTKQFIIEAIGIHGNKYEYPGEYINARTDIEIKCKKHGIFLQVPDVHLNGSGCPTCSSNVSAPEMRWLDSLGIPNDNIHRHCKIYLGNSYIKPDGFDPKTNTIYEFYGDYFHGNPLIFHPDTINKKNKKTCGELYNETINREKMIKEAGYNLVFIWESEWKNKN